MEILWPQVKKELEGTSLLSWSLLPLHQAASGTPSGSRGTAGQSLSFVSLPTPGKLILKVNTGLSVLLHTGIMVYSLYKEVVPGLPAIRGQCEDQEQHFSESGLLHLSDFWASQWSLRLVGWAVCCLPSCSD